MMIRAIDTKLVCAIERHWIFSKEFIATLFRSPFNEQNTSDPLEILILKQTVSLVAVLVGSFHVWPEMKLMRHINNVGFHHEQMFEKQSDVLRCKEWIRIHY